MKEKLSVKETEQITNSATDALEMKPVKQLLLSYALPAIIAMLINSIYNVVDRMFIGQGVGAMAISGLAFTLPFLNIQTAFGTLIGVGASARVSIVLGKKDIKWAENILGNCILLTLIFSGGFSLVSFIFMEEMLGLLGASEATMPYAVEYLTVVLPGVLFTSFTYNFANVMRASGHPKKSMMIFLIGAFLNILLDALFILVFGWGIKGAGLATVLSMIVTCIIATTHFLSDQSIIRFRMESLRLRKKIVKNVLSIGVSPFSMNLVASVVTAFYTNLLMKYGGDLAVGAYGIVNSYALLIVMTVMGLCQGMQPIVGYNYGAQRLTRVKEAYRITAIAATIVTTLGFVGAFFFPEFLCRAFTNDEQLLSIAAPGLRIMMLMFPLVGFQIVTGNLFMHIGKAGMAIFLSLARQLIFLIPAIYLCGQLWELEGLWYSTVIADALAVIVTIIIIIKKRPF